MSSESELYKRMFLIRHFDREDLRENEPFFDKIKQTRDITSEQKIYLSNPGLSNIENLPRNGLAEVISKIRDIQEYKTEDEFIVKSKIVYDLFKESGSEDVKDAYDFIKKYNDVLSYETIRVEEHIIKERYNNIKKQMVTYDVIKKRELLKYFNNENSIIFCSPFLRCMETANIISTLLGIESININFNLSELCTGVLMPWYIPEFDNGTGVNINNIYENSLKRINEKHIDISKFTLMHSDSLRIINDNESGSYEKRIYECLEYLYHNTDKQFILIITHSDSLRQFAGTGMDFYKKYEITDKFTKLLSGGYFKKFNKYINKINLISRQ